MFLKIKEYASPLVILLSTTAVIAFNIIANVLPLNNQYTNVISDRYQTAFTPLGYVFSIWGLIYILLALFAIWAFVKYKYHKDFIDSIVVLHVLATVFNIVWLITWHYEEILISMIPMSLLLITLMWTYRLSARKGIKGITMLTFSVYLGWISVAFMANAAIVLNYLNWDGFGLSDLSWVSILLILAAALGFYLLTTFRDRAFYLVIIWASIGIWFKNPEDLYVFGIVFVAIMAFCLRSFLLYIKNKE